MFESFGVTASSSSLLSTQPIMQQQLSVSTSLSSSSDPFSAVSATVSSAAATASTLGLTYTQFLLFRLDLHFYPFFHQGFFRTRFFGRVLSG
jgi:hypothetical protein